MFAIKRTISKSDTHMLVKKYMKLKRTNPMNPPIRVIMNFLLKLLIFRIFSILKKSRMKTLIGPKLYPQMGSLFHTKLIPELNVTLFFRQFWKSLILNPTSVQWTKSYPDIIILKFPTWKMLTYSKASEKPFWCFVYCSRLKIRACYRISNQGKSKPDKTYFCRKYKWWTIFVWVFWLF